MNEQPALTEERVREIIAEELEKFVDFFLRAGSFREPAQKTAFRPIQWSHATDETKTS